jgi:pimeloyl-ACP methyl ester carboxylesterase
VIERIEVAGEPPVRGYLHAARGAGGLVLTHGAGGNAETPLLVAVADAFASRGVSVLRCDLPFPSGAPAWRAVAARLRPRSHRAAGALAVLQERARGRLFLGGHSYGGRQASLLVAEEATLVTSLLLQSYPCTRPESRASSAAPTGLASASRRTRDVLAGLHGTFARARRRGRQGPRNGIVAFQANPHHRRPHGAAVARVGLPAELAECRLANPVVAGPEPLRHTTQTVWDVVMSPALPPYRVRAATVRPWWRSDGDGKRATSAAWRTVPLVG